jgi:micrococcal nuclease
MAVGTLGSGCRDRGDEAGPQGPGEATVVAVIDGDTIDVMLGSRRERVRLLGIDTPETVDERRPVGCFGPEASARTAALLPKGTAVRLERDVEARDRFDRLLAYVHRRSDGLFVNLTLLEEGYAEVLVIEPNHAEVAALRAARDRARSAGRGLWGACGEFGRPIDPGTGPSPSPSPSPGPSATR